MLVSKPYLIGYKIKCLMQPFESKLIGIDTDIGKIKALSKNYFESCYDV